MESDHAQAEVTGGHGGGLAGVLTVAVATAVAVVSTLWNAATRDGTLAAWFRQGADEIGIALKAFPESIHAEEPGTILNPTQGEIAADRKPQQNVYNRPVSATQAGHPSPSAIARESRDSVHGQEQERGDDRAVTPSSIAKEQAASVYGAESGQASPSPSEIARDSGTVLTQEGGFVDREMERREKAKEEGNAGNDQNQRERGRSLPEEQKEQEKELDRGGRCR